MIEISCEFAVSLGRFLRSDYIRALDLTVYSFDENGDRVVLGKIAGDQLMLAEAELDDEDIFEICDQDSQGLYEVYEALFDKGGEFQHELALNEPTAFILFLWRSVFHPKLKPYQQAILEAVANLFGNEGVLAMWRHVGDISDKELADLGFRKIAGTELIFRHLALRTAFSDAYPQGIEVPLEFEAFKEEATVVLAEWHKDDPDHQREHDDNTSA